MEDRAAGAVDGEGPQVPSSTFSLITVDSISTAELYDHADDGHQHHHPILPSHRHPILPKRGQSVPPVTWETGHDPATSGVEGRRAACLRYSQMRSGRHDSNVHEL